jgi:hypothetical protein
MIPASSSKQMGAAYTMTGHLYAAFTRWVAISGIRGLKPFNQGGTIEKYLEAQGASVFMRAADLYLELLCFLLETIKDKTLSPTQAETVLKTVSGITEGRADENDLMWIDMDRTITDFCRQSGTPIPITIDERMAIHITAVRKWAV